ncbi:MAG TPA: hypothetical protein VFE22_02910 [Edaphobacter sp.]|nr:hypothetical protein [Edaphobacter sp.]
MRKEEQFPTQQIPRARALHQGGLTWGQIAQRFGYPASRGVSLAKLVNASAARLTAPAPAAVTAQECHA